MAKEILCAFGVDVDAVAGWLGSYGGADSPLDISRGMFSGEVGSPRDLIEILDASHDAEELLEHTRLAIYQDRIFAYNVAAK